MLNYKRIVASRRARLTILKIFGWIPAPLMVRFQYRIKHSRWPRLRNPQRFSEWIQWYKLNHRDPLMTLCADKIAARAFVAARGHQEIVNELYSVISHPEQLNMDQLPSKFVIKTNNGSGTNILCRDVTTFDVAAAKSKIAEWLSRENYLAGKEWCYRDIVPLVLIERLLEDFDNEYFGINDYKFLCFDGRAEYVVVDVDRDVDHKRNIYTRDWIDTGVSTDRANIPGSVPRPGNLERMLEIAEALSEDFPFARVDLYSIQDRIYFGEITFYPWSGYIQFAPDSFDYHLGSLWTKNHCAKLERRDK